MGEAWRVVKAGLAGALSLLEKGVIKLQRADKVGGPLDPMVLLCVLRVLHANALSRLYHIHPPHIQAQPAAPTTTAAEPRPHTGMHQPPAPTPHPQVREQSKWLWGNFAPVEGDLFSANCPITGTLPKEVSGLFARNGEGPRRHATRAEDDRCVAHVIHGLCITGPNPVHITAGYHW
jgi:hypothetical protein